MRGNKKIKINRPTIIGTQPISNIFLLCISVILTSAYLSPGGFLECKMRPWKMCKCISLIIYINFWRKQYYQERVRNYWNEFGKSSIRREIRITFSIMSKNEISPFSRETMEKDSAVRSWWRAQATPTHKRKRKPVPARKCEHCNRIDGS